MPHRKLVQIGAPVQLPTVGEFLRKMAALQQEEIHRLKAEVLGKAVPANEETEYHNEVTPYSWQLHPVRVKRAPKKSAKKAKKVAKKSSKKRPAKKAAKKSARNMSKRPARKTAKKK